MNDSLRDYVARLGADCELNMRDELLSLDRQDFDGAMICASNAESDSFTAFAVCKAALA